MAGSRAGRWWALALLMASGAVHVAGVVSVNPLSEVTSLRQVVLRFD